MKIGHCDTDQKVLIIAEIGNNHEGDYTLAEEMIGLAAQAGAGGVKFQTFRTEHYVSHKDEARFAMLKRFELTEEELRRLKKTADDAGILFLSTPFDLKSAEFLNELVPAFKIASGDNTFYPLIEKVASFQKPILLSTGMASLPQISYAKALIDKVWADLGTEQELVLLHCVTSYPVPPKEVNLKMIALLERTFGCVVGYSDHTLGIETAIVSVAAGARIVEKHFTMNKTYSDFRDHQLSADPEDLKALVEQIRRVEESLGSDLKVLQDCEKPLVKTLRRSIVATRDMDEGDIVGPEDITWVRVTGTIPPGKEALVLGKRLTKPVPKGEPFTTDALK